MVVKCEDCGKTFEPPFDSAEFKVWIDACAEVEEYLCFTCAGVDAIIGVDSIEIVLEDPTDAETHDA